MTKQILVNYCGVCPDFKTLLYYKDKCDFENGVIGEMREIYYCDFFIFPIQLTEKEYKNIPQWCPLDNEVKEC
jgi:hypothetical protein